VPPTPKAKPPTAARKLASALEACRKKPGKRRRAACERQVRKRYAPKAKRSSAPAHSKSPSPPKPSKNSTTNTSSNSSCTSPTRRLAARARAPPMSRSHSNRSSNAARGELHGRLQARGGRVSWLASVARRAS
jgi:hypothetical protein